jgi:ABC-2 type transport system permease protein
MQQYWRETAAQCYRWLRRLKREPVSIAYALFQPLIWLLLFSGVFQRVIDVESIRGDSYVAFLTPGAIALTVFGNSMTAGIPVLFDKEYGYLNRLLVAPISRSSIILSRFLMTTMITTGQAILILLVAWAMGVQIASGFGGVVAVLALGALFGLGVTAISLALAFLLHSHVEYFAIISMLTLPLLFISTALAPTAMMSPWMQMVVQFNPMTWAVDAMRTLVLSGWDMSVIVRSAIFLLLFDGLALIVSTALLRPRLLRV